MKLQTTGDPNLKIHPNVTNIFIGVIRMSQGIRIASNSGHSDVLNDSHLFKAFTLIELLLYVGIAGVIMLSVSVLLSLVLQARVKSQAIAEVEQQGQSVTQIFGQTVRNANSITSPSLGTSASSLTLVVPTPSLSPTVFDPSSGTIRIKEGSGSPVVLTNSRVTASNLTFSNLSRAGTFGTIRVSFTLTHLNPENRQEYNFSKTFYGSASLR